MSDLVSVIIPTKNRSIELKRAITSVLNQTHQNFEVLVIDDHSNEDIQKVVQSFQNDRIHYSKSNKQPSNANVCRNIGIENAKGAYIAMLDSDDEWLANHLQLKLINIKLSNTDGVFGSIIVDDGQKKTPVISRAFYENEKMVNYLLSGGSVQTSSHFYKAECAKDILWDETFIRHQDYDFSVRFAEKYIFSPTNDITCIVHWKKGELRTQHIESQIKFIEKYRDTIIPKLYNQYFYILFSKIEMVKDSSDSIKKYVRLESCRYIGHCSLNDYMTVNAQNKNLIIRLFYRIKFIFKIISL